MSKRLQVILADPEYRELQRAARRHGMSVAQWVREALVLAQQQESSGRVEQKLEALRTASKFQFPIGDIKQVLAEIERGYLAIEQ